MKRTKILGLALVAVFAMAGLASASASAINLEWEVQGCVTGTATIKFTTSSCETESATGTFTETGAVEKLAAGKKRKVTSKGGEFVLNAGKTTEIKCTGVTDKGTITGGKPGTDLAEEIDFTGCTTPVEVTCQVRSPGKPFGTILVTNIPTKLVEAETSTGAKVLGDLFEGKGATKEFVTLEFETTSKKACSDYPSPTKVTGNITAEVVGEELNFPNPALKGNTLEAFGTKATLKGKDTQKGAGGGTVKAS